MIDSAKIYAKTGDGGRGCNSFKGVKFTRSRHPDGGEGGKGADIIIRVDRNIQDLEEFRAKQHFRGANGGCGQANKKKGTDARPYIIKVPPGTIIYDFKNNLFLRDLTTIDEEFVVAKGGEGGKGNARTRSATAGLPGEQRYLALELKLRVDIGIIGYPNAGKSSLLTKLSSAKPKVAAYPFTTTSPFLAALVFYDFVEPSNLTLVEIPGIIKGSNGGKGLGAKSLRHTERAKLLIHLIDISGQDQRDPVEDYQDLNQELESYNPALLQKPQILVANKMDLPQARQGLEDFTSKIQKKIYPISALNGTGVEELLDGIRNHFRQSPRQDN